MAIPQPAWPIFAWSSNLAFRTACNEAAPAAFRPVKRSVLELVANNRDAGRIYDDLIAANPGITEQAILAALVADARWRTLVVEAVDEINRLGETYKSIGEYWHRGVEWFRKKPVNGGPSPRDKVIAAAVTATTAATSVGAGITAVNLVTNDRLQVPVVLKMPSGNESTLHVSVSAPDDAVPIKFAVAPIDHATIPIEITTKANAAPLQLSMADVKVLESIEKTISNYITTIKNTSANAPISTEVIAELKALNKAITDVHAPSPIATADLKPAMDALTKIAASLENQPQPRAMQDLTAELQQAGKALNRIGGLAAAGRTLTTLAALENQETTAQVDWPSAGGAVDACEVTIKAGKITRTVDIKELRVKCDDQPARTVALTANAKQARPGDVLRGGKLPFGLAVDTIQRPMFGPNIAVLRIFAAPLPERAPAADVRQTASK